MAYVPVPKDLTRVKTKFLFNLTKRQVICFGLGALAGVPLFFLTKSAIGASMATLLMIAVMLPFFMFAMFERHGQPLEKLLRQYIQARYVRPRTRVYKLVRYTIPEQLLANDENFLRLMIEAEKYIGYPYVYGGSSPKTGFDCSGFVCWVFRQSGVYDTGRKGANGLYSLCTDIPAEEARPGDLVFFEKTMGSNVKGITHVGIYVGNSMMIHAGDPVGFADLKSDKWANKLYGYGRLPID